MITPLFSRLDEPTTSSVLASLTVAADAIAGGDFDTVLPAPTPETAPLVAAMARLAASLQASAGVAEQISEGDLTDIPAPKSPRDRLGVALTRMAGYLGEMTVAADRVSEGDLSVRVRARSTRDALGLALGNMVDRTGGMLRDVSEATRAMTATAEQMRVVSRELRASAARSADDARRSAGSVQQLHVEVRGASARARDLEARAIESASALQEGTAVMQASLGVLEEMLEKSAVVRTFATQTDEIAFNASMEAASAGVAGRGFQAVAQEVHSLAKSAWAEAAKMKKLAEVGAASAQVSSGILERLGPGLDDGIAMVHAVTEASGAQAEELSSLSGHMSVLAEASSRTETSSAKLATTAESLAQFAAKLDAMMDSFRLGDDAQIAAALRPNRGPVVYRTPSHSDTAFPKLALCGG